MNVNIFCMDFAEKERTGQQTLNKYRLNGKEKKTFSKNNLLHTMSLIVMKDLNGSCESTKMLCMGK